MSNSKSIDEKINAMNNVEHVFEFLTDVLDYNNSANFHNEKSDEYDAFYSLEIEHKKYTLIGIKKYEEKDEEAILKKHLQYWNENEIPFSILVLPDEIRIYNNFTISKKKLLYSSKQKKDSIIELFTEANILNGLLQEKLQSTFNKNERVDSFLLNNLRNTITNLFCNYGMDLEDAYNFLAQCIFIKYMEDRQMLTESTFAEFGVQNFNQLLQLEDVELIKKLFIWLKKRFNGDLFEIDYTNWPTGDQIKVIKSFFEADEIYANGIVQYTLVKYDFSKIPIELISNIYETFFNLGDNLLNKKYSSKNGAYYTPYYLAEFMNDRCMEKCEKNYLPVVLDPACGSGVFLVGAFRRMVERKKAASVQISEAELKNILLNNIFGIDRNLKALKLTCFSLYIALLEYLTPKDIQKNQFKFPNLIGKTLFCGDSFDEELKTKKIKADIIIGNPPWVSDKEGIHNKYCKKRHVPISDGQTAQAFIARAQDFAKENGIVAFIVTNSIFTNENAVDFRKYILKQFQIEEVFNLYKVRDGLFSHATAPCSILTYKCKKQEQEYRFKYYAFCPNLLSETFQKIVYDKANVIDIKNTIILNNDYIWRVLNSGDEYDVRVINKIKTFPKLKDRGYKYFRGYVVGTKKTKQKTEFLKYKGGNLREAYHPYLIDYDALPQMTECQFERSRKLDGYLCKNKLLIKRTYNANLSGAAFCEQPVIFTDDYHCLYDSNDDNCEELKLVEAFLNSSIFEYYRFFASKMANSIKPEISKEDILSFPIPQDIESGKRIELLRSISQMEKLLKRRYAKGIFQDYEMQELNFEIEETKQKIDCMVLEVYRLDEVEKEVIRYALEYVIPQKREKEGCRIPCCEQEIYHTYAGYVEKYFNNFLGGTEFKLTCQKIYSQNLFTLISFRIQSVDEKDTEEMPEEILKKIVDILGLTGIENIDSELLVKKRLSGFLSNGFFVVKEKETKNWTLMNAIKDVEYFSKLILEEKEEGT